MRKLLILALFLMAILLVSCNTETPSESVNDDGNHVHDFTFKIDYDENGHTLTCECGETKNGEHVEGSGSFIVKKATCISEGSKYIVCEDCGYRGEISLPKTDHTLEKHEAVTATCIKEGVTAYEHCTFCGINIGKETFPKISHDYKDGVCTMCGSHEPSEYIRFEFHEIYGWTVMLNFGDPVDHTDLSGRYDLPITELYIPSYTDTGEKVVGIGGFKDVQQLKKVILPEGIQYIDEYAFYGCANLEEVQFLGDPNSVLTIKQFAFHGCRNLKKL